MIEALKTVVSPNLRIQSLQQQLAIAGTSEVEWLVICHTDPLMSARVTDALVARSLLLLQAPQSFWCFPEGDLATAVSWALTQANARRVLLCAHSLGGVPEVNAAAPTAQAFRQPVGTHSHSSDSSDQGPRQGVLRSQQRLQQAQDHFCQQLDRLCLVNQLHSRLFQGQADVLGLFYLAESGSFLYYEPAEDALRPLSGETFGS